MNPFRSALLFASQRAAFYSDIFTSPRHASVQLLHSAPKRARKLAILAHFDVHGRIDPYVHRYLDELTCCGFDTAIVSTCAALDPADVTATSELCRMIATRTNRGIDFGSWKVGLELIDDWQSYERLLLINDSVFGPLFPMEPLFSKADAFCVPLVGMTDSDESLPHLQSYFLHFNLQHAGCAAFVAWYYDRIRLLNSKHNAIAAYEMPLATTAQRRGLAWRALFPAKDQPGFKPRATFNPTHDAWDAIIQTMGFPFLKRELLTRNPKQVPGIERWPQLIRDAGSTYDPELIRNYLHRIQSPR